MKTFIDFISEDIITEALRTPVEYYMTDDTNIPSQIYASFDIEGGKYVIALVETKTQGVYTLEMGKTSSKGGKVLWWRFHKSNHLMRALATTIHFAEASMFMLAGKVKGIGITLRAADKAQTAARLTQRIVARSHIKSMEYVPVVQPAASANDKYYYQKQRTIFVVKKHLKVSSLFKGTEYNKYDFSGNKVPQEAIDNLKPKLAVKTAVKVQPSAKYSFGEFGVKTPDNSQELISKLSSVKPIDNSNQSTSKQPPDRPAHSNANHLALLFSIDSLSKMIDNLKANGYDQSKINFDNLSFVLDKATSAEKDLLINYGYINSQQNITDSAKEKWKSAMQQIASGAVAGTDALQKVDQYKKDFQQYQNNNSQHVSKALKSNINPEDLVSTIGQQLQTFNGRTFVGGSPYDQVDIAVSAFENMDGLQHSKLRQSIGATSYDEMVAYSGHAFTDFNEPLREALKVAIEQSATDYDKDKIKSIIGNKTNKIVTLMSAFEKVPPVTESFWVYRGTFLTQQQVDKIVPGYDYVDGAFMSTSLKPNISFGSSKIRIFIPKQSKVLPILNHSKHASEKEILLPPCSVIKVIEVLPGNSSGTIGFTGVLIGSAVASVLQKVQQLLEQPLNSNQTVDMINLIERIVEKMDNTKKDDKYNPEDKFGDQYDDQLAQLISDAIKKGKLKLSN